MKLYVYECSILCVLINEQYDIYDTYLGYHENV